MNSFDPPPRPPRLDERILTDLLDQIRQRFYGTQPPARFHRDRRMLLYALTWPAVWLERRGLTCSAPRYHQLIVARLDAIRTHGDPACYSTYFPRYLLKCLQDWFEHHGPQLYDELKHIRNALDQVLASVHLATRIQRDARQLDVLAATHHILHRPRPPRSSADPHQLAWF
jgi:hypothetical protein